MIGKMLDDAYQTYVIYDDPTVQGGQGLGPDPICSWFTTVVVP